MTTDYSIFAAEAPRVHYEPGDPVWVGRSRGSEREGIVVRHLGEGLYGVSVGEREEPRTIEGPSFTRAENKEGAL